VIWHVQAGTGVRASELSVKRTGLLLPPGINGRPEGIHGVGVGWLDPATHRAPRAGHMRDHDDDGGMVGVDVLLSLGCQRFSAFSRPTGAILIDLASYPAYASHNPYPASPICARSAPDWHAMRGRGSLAV
jgi:hypothetical protein